MGSGLPRKGWDFSTGTTGIFVAALTTPAFSLILQWLAAVAISSLADACGPLGQYSCNSLQQFRVEFYGGLVREEGFEPPRVLPRQVLSLLRLPFRHSRNDGRIIPQNWLRLPSWVIEAHLRL